jgi:MucB/RseB N-terminal domain
MSYYRDRKSPKIRVFAVAACIFILAGSAIYSQTAASGSPTGATLSSAQPALTSTEIVEQMMRHNATRAEGLKHYQSVRRYEVEYKGYSVKLDAKMVVEVTYDAANGKTLRIVSQSGNGLLVDKVLKRLIESEKDAALDKSSTALTPANYKFTLAGRENVAGRPAYVLNVVPLIDSKYLYRGKIWVDTADFAVARIEAEPAKNPSVWISRTAISHQYVRTGGFWLPAQNRSETKVRVGGTAVLTIDYGKYQVVPESPVAGEASNSGPGH